MTDFNVILQNDLLRIRELIGFLVSLAAQHDQVLALKFANELETLLPKAKSHD